MAPYSITVFILLLRNLNVIANGACSVMEQTYTIIHCSASIELDLEFHVYTRENPTVPYILSVDNEISLWQSPLQSHRRTIIFIHGFAETANDVTPTALRNAYLSHNDFNIILVDWSKLAIGPWYFSAVRNTKEVGPCIGKFVDWLAKAQVIDISNLHVIGFSLGAHISGFMGKALLPQKVGRITGLDPAGPSFENVPPSERLDKSDAIFVDVIHTNCKNFGLYKPVGHADFYPNSGITQPGCKFYAFGCSHSRARPLYIESISRPFAFPAKKCQHWMPTIRDCDTFPTNYMGSQTQVTDGIFLLETNAQSPFGRYMKDYHYPNIKESCC